MAQGNFAGTLPSLHPMGADAGDGVGQEQFRPCSDPLLPQPAFGCCTYSRENAKRGLNQIGASRR